MSDTEDPFAPSADPYGTDDPYGTELDRRGFAKALALVGAVVALPSCLPHRLACEPVPRHGQTCQHRHCRYFSSSRVPSDDGR